MGPLSKFSTKKVRSNISCQKWAGVRRHCRKNKSVFGKFSRKLFEQDILQANPALERLFAAAQAQQAHLPPNPSSTRLQGLPVDRFHTVEKQRGTGQPRSPRRDKDRQDAALLRQWLQASHVMLLQLRLQLSISSILCI